MFVENLVIGSCLRSLRHSTNMRTNLIYINLNEPFAFESRHYEWKNLFIEMCLSGKILYHSMIKGIEVKPENKLVSITSRTFKKHRIYYENLYVYDTSNLTFDNTIPSKINTCNLIYDWFDLTSVDRPVAISDIEKIDIIDKAWLHDGSLIVRSKLTDEQIMDISFSDTYFKFLIQNKLIDLGYLEKKMQCC